MSEYIEDILYNINQAGNRRLWFTDNELNNIRNYLIRCFESWNIKRVFMFKEHSKLNRSIIFEFDSDNYEGIHFSGTFYDRTLLNGDIKIVIEKIKRCRFDDRNKLYRTL